MDHIKVELDFIPIEERVPKDGTSALILVENICFPYAAYRKNGQWMWGFSNKPIEPIVTHWAKIPNIGE